MDREMEKETLIEKIRLRAADNRIHCTEALKVAEEAKVSPKVVGDLLDELHIKISGCQLGCFPKASGTCGVP
jgi:hypothetical protein